VRPLPVPALSALLGALLWVAPSADAAWNGSGDGPAAGRALVMPAGQMPVARVSGTDVTVQWSAALLRAGTPVAGYRIRRYDVNGNPSFAQASCDATVATTTCVEHNVPAGTWTYTDTPLQQNWTGTASPPSNAVTVAG
jgi:hypothetical protein